jgi:hypothetical protein
MLILPRHPIGHLTKSGRGQVKERRVLPITVIIYSLIRKIIIGIPKSMLPKGLVQR